MEKIDFDLGNRMSVKGFAAIRKVLQMGFALFHEGSK